MHSRAHNFRIKLSGLRLGDHGNWTSVHNGRNCWERRCSCLFSFSLCEAVEPGAWLASGASQSLTRQLFIRGGHRRPFSPTFSSLNINYSPESRTCPIAASKSGTHVSPLLCIYLSQLVILTADYPDSWVIMLVTIDLEKARMVFRLCNYVQITLQIIYLQKSNRGAIKLFIISIVWLKQTRLEI